MICPSAGPAFFIKIERLTKMNILKNEFYLKMQFIFSFSLKGIKVRTGDQGSHSLQVRSIVNLHQVTGELPAFLNGLKAVLCSWTK